MTSGGPDTPGGPDPTPHNGWIRWDTGSIIKLVVVVPWALAAFLTIIGLMALVILGKPLPDLDIIAQILGLLGVWAGIIIYSEVKKRDG